MWCEVFNSHINSESQQDNTPQSERNELKEFLEKINKKYSIKEQDIYRKKIMIVIMNKMETKIKYL